MTVTRLGRDAGETYTMRMGYDPDADQQILVRTYLDGTTTFALRPGNGRRDVQWSPEYELTAVTS
jgi:hypothetical protein